MPTFRPDLNTIDIYSPGKPIDEVARELGITDIIKVASNEHPEAPFPEVREAIAAAAAGVNRYPEDSSHYLVEALADKLEVSPQNLWVGAGSSQLLSCTALSVGGPGTSAVFAKPSFVMYSIATAVAGATAVQVSTDSRLRHDLDAMAGAIRSDTTVVYVCNPNNPTGTHVAAQALRDFVAAIPKRVLVIVDEAYAEYATASDFATAIPLALERDNVLVTRTFSKIYGLAGLRVGYAIGRPKTLAALRRVQPPFSVSSVAQAAALAAIAHDDRLQKRVDHNASRRGDLEAALAERGIEFAESQANFVLFSPPVTSEELWQAMLERGVIVRSLGPWIRVSVGTVAENRRFVEALDDATVELAS